jgi:hypothetical protein
MLDNVRYVKPKYRAPDRLRRAAALLSNAAGRAEPPAVRTPTHSMVTMNSSVCPKCGRSTTLPFCPIHGVLVSQFVAQPEFRAGDRSSVPPDREPPPEPVAFWPALGAGICVLLAGICFCLAAGAFVVVGYDVVVDIAGVKNEINWSDGYSYAALACVLAAGCAFICAGRYAWRVRPRQPPTRQRGVYAPANPPAVDS